MKLFTAKQATSSFNNKQAQDIAQIAYLQTTLTSLQKQINTENTQFEQRLKELREVYGAEKEKLQEEVRFLQGQVKILSEKRKGLLVPFGNLKEQAEELLADAQLKIINLSFKEEELEELQQAYQAKIDDLSTRETDIVTREQSLELRIKATEEEAKQVSSGHERLNALLLDANKRIAEQSKSLAEKESAILLREQSFNTYKVSLEKELAEEKRGLVDKRKALDRGFAELERLKSKLNKK